MTTEPPVVVVRVGTRTSTLALAQTALACQAIAAEHARRRVAGELSYELQLQTVPIGSDADEDPRPIAELPTRGLFAARLERALADGRIDLAVHSLKDVPLGEPVADTTLSTVAILKREDVRDAMCLTSARCFDDLPRGAVVATGSARRAAALAALRSDIVVRPIRGNVQTRLARAREWQCDACMLATAGLVRLELDATIAWRCELDEIVPEPGQGAIAVRARNETSAWPLPHWGGVDDAASRQQVLLERMIATELGGGCEVPIGVHAQPVGAQLRVRVFWQSKTRPRAVCCQCDVPAAAALHEQVSVVMGAISAQSDQPPCMSAPSAQATT